MRLSLLRMGQSVSRNPEQGGACTKLNTAQVIASTVLTLLLKLIVLLNLLDDALEKAAYCV